MEHAIVCETGIVDDVVQLSVRFAVRLVRRALPRHDSEAPHLIVKSITL